MKFILILGLVLALLIEDIYSIVAKDYCKHSPKGTVCTTRCAVDSKCKKFYTDFKPFTDKEKEFMLELHNAYRNDLAGGKLKDFNQPQGSDINILSWDKECEFTSTCWIFQCFWGHDPDRKSITGDYLGQNLATKSTTAPTQLSLRDSVKTACDSWWDEYKFLKSDALKTVQTSFMSNPNKKEAIGHYTQMAWGSTKYVGCGFLISWRANNSLGGKPTVTADVYCNYKPTGNIVKRPMYTAGAPASACAVKGNNTQYPNLCGNIRPYSEDTFEPPSDAKLDANIHKPIALLYLNLILYALFGFHH